MKTLVPFLPCPATNEHRSRLSGGNAHDAALASGSATLAKRFAAGAPDRVGRLLFNQLLLHTGQGLVITYGIVVTSQTTNGLFGNKHVACQKT